MTFVHDWLWPAGGSGGVPGDVFGTFIWVLIVGAFTYAIYKPIRKAIDAWLRERTEEIKAHVTAEHQAVHDKLNHIIKHSKEIPDYKDGR